MPRRSRLPLKLPCLSWQLAKTHRPFTATIFDPAGSILMTVERPFYFVSTSLFVRDAYKSDIGEVHMNWYRFYRCPRCLKKKISLPLMERDCTWRETLHPDWDESLTVSTIIDQAPVEAEILAVSQEETVFAHRRAVAFMVWVCERERGSECCFSCVAVSLSGQWSLCWRRYAGLHAHFHNHRLPQPPPSLPPSRNLILCLCLCA